MMNRWLLPITCALMAAVLLYCGSSKVDENQRKEQAYSEEVIRGKQLAKGLCASCHLPPSPADLDKKSWERYVLPRMGNFFGIYHDSLPRKALIEEGQAAAFLDAYQIYPETQLIEEADWRAICSYYLHEAPDKLPSNNAQPINQDNKTFKAVRPAFSLQPPSTTLIQYLPDEQRLILGDAYTSSLFVLNPSLESIGTVKLGEAPVAISTDAAYYYLTVMGSFAPTDAPVGSLVRVKKDGTGLTEVLLKGLQRPVHHAVGDLDQDGLQDIVVCEFAKWTGSLNWYKNLGNGSYERRILKKETGSLKAFLKDWNSDGLLDVVALFGQGNEGIFLFLNQGAGGFEEVALKRFPPSFGSSYMALQDLNNDGLEDIIYCAGDNADFPPILKPYHGVYTFLRSNDTLVQQDFHPLNGAYAAEIMDFDVDGDLDVAAISFFPDFKGQPQQGFVFFEQTKPNTFQASSFPEVKSGRWIVMDATDIDADGDQDLLLGALAFEVPGNKDLVEQWVRQGIAFVVLENKSK